MLKLQQHTSAAVSAWGCLPGFANVVEQLVMNAVGAGASKVHIILEPETFTVTISDNGQGLTATEMTALSQAKDLAESSPVTTTTAVLMNLCKVCDVELTTTAPDGTVLQATVPAPSARTPTMSNRLPPGMTTSAIITNMFGRLPIRAKALNSRKETGKAVAALQAFAVIHHAVALTVVSCTDKKSPVLLETRGSPSIAAAFSAVHGCDLAAQACGVDLQDMANTIRGIVGASARTEAKQLFVNGRRVTHCQPVFSAVSKAIHAIPYGVVCGAVTLPSTITGPQAWLTATPLFALHVSCPPTDVALLHDGATTTAEFHNTSRIVRAVRTAIRDAFYRGAAAVSEPPTVPALATPTAPAPRPRGGAGAAPGSPSPAVPTPRTHWRPFVSPPAAPAKRRRVQRAKSVPQLFKSWEAKKPTVEEESAVPTVGVACGKPAPAWGRSKPAAGAAVLDDGGGVSTMPLAVSKAALKTARVIAQVERKFVLAACDDGALLCIDQHAADERVHLEAMQERFQVFSGVCPPEVTASVLPTATSVPATARDLVTLSQHGGHIRSWRFRFRVGTGVVWLEAVPVLLGKPVPPAAFLPFVRAVADSPGTSPPAVHELLASKACRGAIMFGDELSMAQCKALVAALGKCQFPFQCAHGRPSLVPICRLPN